MAGRVEKTVFISYRRANLPWALFIYQNLTMHGYDVFFDYQSIDSGSFEKVIIDNIRARAHFVLILTPSALERCNKPGDWLRREIETAIEEKRNIVPLMVEGFDFGSQFVKEALTGKLTSLSGINALRIPDDYALEAMDRLRERFLNIALSDVNLPTLQPEAEKATEIQKTAANEAEPVQEKQLTAQTWYERGFVFKDEKIFDEAIRCFTKAIMLDPKLSSAYTLRGLVYEEQGQKELALQDYTRSINLNLGDHGAFVFRGFIREDRKDFEGAKQDYTAAIKIKGDEPTIYVFRGLTQIELGESDEAIEDYSRAIGLDGGYANAHYYRAIAWEIKFNYQNAIEDYKKYLKLENNIKEDKKEMIKNRIHELERKMDYKNFK